ncbi:MAG: hypothetical protein ABJC07_08070 [Acidobacteriota bacterium]
MPVSPARPFHDWNLPEAPGRGRRVAAKLLARQAIDFEGQLILVSGFLEKHGYRHALVGAFAPAACGLPRTTLAPDIAVEATAQDSVVAFLEVLGYETIHRSEGYSNHLHADRDRGRIDLASLDAKTAEALFSAARPFPGPGGRPIPVPKPEHLAPMKVVAMKNDPGRTFQDLADVRFVLGASPFRRRSLDGGDPAMIPT